MVVGQLRVATVRADDVGDGGGEVRRVGDVVDQGSVVGLTGSRNLQVPEGCAQRIEHRKGLTVSRDALIEVSGDDRRQRLEVDQRAERRQERLVVVPTLPVLPAGVDVGPIPGDAHADDPNRSVTGVGGCGDQPPAWCGVIKRRDVGPWIPGPHGDLAPAGIVHLIAPVGAGIDDVLVGGQEIVEDLGAHDHVRVGGQEGVGDGGPMNGCDPLRVPGGDAHTGRYRPAVTCQPTT